MQDEEWIKTLEDSRMVKFIYQELLADGAFISAQVADHEVLLEHRLMRKMLESNGQKPDHFFECPRKLQRSESWHS